MLAASAYVFLAVLVEFAVLAVAFVALRTCSFRAWTSLASCLVAFRANSNFPCCTASTCSSSSLVATSAAASCPSTILSASQKACMP